ncbi:hypothetical protein ACS0PU_011123 [Formica fusca]
MCIEYSICRNVSLNSIINFHYYHVVSKSLNLVFFRYTNICRRQGKCAYNEHILSLRVIVETGRLISGQSVSIDKRESLRFPRDLITTPIKPYGAQRTESSIRVHNRIRALYVHMTFALLNRKCQRDNLDGIYDTFI